jgi:hypothetical protein
MKKLLTLAALGGAVAVTACATPGGAGSMPGRGPGVWLNDGDAYTATVKDETTFSFFGQEAKQSTRIVMGLDVLRGGADPRWRWTIADAKLETLAGGDEALGIDGSELKFLNEVVGPMVRLIFVMGFECKPDAAGACAELTNLGQWRGVVEDGMLIGDGFTKMMLLNSLPGMPGGEEFEGGPGGMGGLDQRSMDLVVNIGLNLLDGWDAKSAGAVITSSTWGPIMVQGTDLRPGAPMAFSRSLPLPYGGGAIVFSGDRQVVSVDRATGTAVVVTRTKLDGKVFAASLLTMFDNLATPNIKAFAAYDPENGAAMVAMLPMLRTQMETVLNASKLDFTETTRGVIDLKTGLARETRTEYNFTFKGGGDFDWVDGKIGGVQTMTITPGAPTITRLSPRTIAPPPPRAALPKAEDDDGPAVATPPAEKPKPRPRRPRR